MWIKKGQWTTMQLEIERIRKDNDTLNEHLELLMNHLKLCFDEIPATPQRTTIITEEELSKKPKTSIPSQQQRLYNQSLFGEMFHGLGGCL